MHESISRIAGLAALALLGACAQQPMPEDAPVPQARPQAAGSAAGWRTEPVIYNGRRYAVAFRRVGARERLVKISAPGRRLGSTKGDGRVVAQIATSAVHHFTCRDGQAARVKPGSLRARGGAWTLVVICR